ncbi:porphobilinogen deaminase [Aspergillus alliaceus]|uniref:Porphobilinogen deaminase n=1 Tax=Petromyces alliaceus TaxID=209559 RepID=A0A5N7CJQ4_PETAA|nr:porphobilinogen deaminase, dipyromethane cofactor binding domain-containing protein [Aspergillus alliaceus]KAB8229096.1 porphobilinogen deaminase, dipyromethane cofactor binding domain-containing protein [Aspergillus alliaceus]KAE8394057.1 porphobilinogen deaminase, dipyromethane cofactor binding domain-containing protein [Aspergillus alliaceus]KAF5861825.1 porphobilinogen deaminase [Aspergillus burnettii]
MASTLNPTSGATNPSPQKTFTVGTRKSKLALSQTELVVAALKEVYPDYEFKIHSQETAGDLNTTIAFREFTTKNLWTEELEEHLMAGRVDFIVHSLKDVPTVLPPTCALGPMMKREDSRDVLVVKKGLPSMSFADMPAGSVVGTSSIRRTAQLALKYPHLNVMDVRGNIGTRLAKLDAEDSPYTCIILAAAGLLRLGLDDRISQYLDSKNGGMLYAVGQGALGIEIRKDDRVIRDMLNNIGHNETTFASLAERSLLRTLEGGCSAPLGVETEWIQSSDGSKKLRMRSIVVSVDGKESAEVEIDGSVESAQAAEDFGVAVAKELVSKGAGKILEDIQRNKQAA